MSSERMLRVFKRDFEKELLRDRVQIEVWIRHCFPDNLNPLITQNSSSYTSPSLPGHPRGRRRSSNSRENPIACFREVQGN